jgi:chromosome segregation ATPase
MGRVVGILGEEYKELRTDSKTFMEKLTTTLGEDLKGARIDHEALAGKLADIDGLRTQIQKLTKEKEQLKERHKSQTTSLNNEHSEEIGKHKSQIAGLELKVKDLEEERVALSDDLTRSRKYGQRLESAMNTADETIPYDEIKNSLATELHAFLLKDSKVPGMVIDGVGKFIDLKKYLGMAAERGAKEASLRVQGKFEETFKSLS